MQNMISNELGEIYINLNVDIAWMKTSCHIAFWILFARGL